MSIKLTRKKIDEIWEKYEEEDPEQMTDWGVILIKAQLKQVVKWGNEYCDCDVEREHPIHRHFCPRCWQALSKEVE